MAYREMYMGGPEAAFELVATGSYRTEFVDTLIARFHLASKPVVFFLVMIAPVSICLPDIEKHPL